MPPVLNKQLTHRTPVANKLKIPRLRNVTPQSSRWGHKRRLLQEKTSVEPICIGSRADIGCICPFFRKGGVDVRRVDSLIERLTVKAIVDAVDDVPARSFSHSQYILHPYMGLGSSATRRLSYFLMMDFSFSERPLMVYKSDTCLYGPLVVIFPATVGYMPGSLAYTRTLRTSSLFSRCWDYAYFALLMSTFFEPPR